MPRNNADVLVGIADYGTTGAILTGPVLSTIPETLDDALAAISGFIGAGYISEEGISLSTEYGTTPVKDMNKSNVRIILNDFTGKVSWVFIQAGYNEWCQLVGSEHVTKTVVNGIAKIHVKIGAHLPAPRAFAVKLKDGDDRALLCLVPNGQVDSGLDITFNAGDVVRIPIEVDCLDDGTGENIHFYDNDSGSEDANTLLSALTVGTLPLTPAFDAAVTEYAASTSSSSVAVTAAAADSGATVAIKNGSTTVTNGQSASLTAGTNTIKVTVTNGSAERVYTVTVTKS